MLVSNQTQLDQEGLANKTWPELGTAQNQLVSLSDKTFQLKLYIYISVSGGPWELSPDNFCQAQFPAPA